MRWQSTRPTTENNSPHDVSAPDRTALLVSTAAAQGSGSDQQQMYNAQAMQHQLMMGQGQMGNMMNPNMMQMGYGGAQGANGQALQ